VGAAGAAAKNILKVKRPSRPNQKVSLIIRGRKMISQEREVNQQLV
jgi:hypothetical protein